MNEDLHPAGHFRSNAASLIRAADPLHAASAEAMLAFARAVKNAQIYPRGSAMRRRSVEAAHEMIRAVCDEFGPLRLKVQQARFLLDAIPAYEDPDDVTGLARRFFRDGVREITFHPGIELVEIESFTAAVVSAGNAAPDADDLVTLLWGIDLPHIRYQVIDDIEWELADDSPGAMEDDAGGSDFLDIEIQELFPAESGPAAAPSTLLESAGTQDPQEALSGREDAPLFLLTPAEESELARSLAGERHSDLRRDTVWVLREILVAWSDAAEDLVAALGRAVRTLVAEEDLQGAAMIVGCLAEEREPRAPAVAEALQRLSAVLSEPEGLALIEKALESEDPGAHRAVEVLVPVLPSRALDGLCEILGRLQGRQARHLLCDALARRPKDDVPAIAKWLADPRWYLVRNIVVVLQGIGDTRAASLIRPVLTHPDLRVRREAFRAFAALGGKDAFAYLARALDDPDSRARVAAAFALAALGEAGIGPLLTAVRRRDFARRPSEERRGFFEALGGTGARVLVPYLERLLKARSFLRRGMQEETACHAAAALGRLGGPDARIALEAGQASGPEAIRLACRQALERLRGGGAGLWN